MTNRNLQEKLTSLKIPKGIPRILTQDDAVKQNIEYIRKRASGELITLSTCYNRLNNAVGGFEPNTILTLSGLSGGGKSTLSKRVVNSMIKDLQSKCKDCLSLSFNFEMLAQKTIGREVSYLSKMPLKKLYSSESPLASAMMERMFKQYHKNLMDYPIIYVEEPQNYNTIGNTIYYFWKSLCRDSGSYMIVEIDHAVITKGLTGDTQKTKVDNLMEILNAIKKKIAFEGGNVFYIVLSQMNRDIKHKDRIMVPEMHYPLTSDLFAASSIEFFSDYIMITHMPSKLNLKYYTDNKFPIWLGNKEKEFIYWHLLKNRDGKPDQIIPMLNNLHHFNFKEVELDDFKTYCEEFIRTGKCTVKKK